LATEALAELDMQRRMVKGSIRRLCPALANLAALYTLLTLPVPLPTMHPTRLLCISFSVSPASATASSADSAQ